MYETSYDKCLRQVREALNPEMKYGAPFSTGIDNSLPYVQSQQQEEAARLGAIIEENNQMLKDIHLIAEDSQKARYVQDSAFQRPEIVHAARNYEDTSVFNDAPDCMSILAQRRAETLKFIENHRG